MNWITDIDGRRIQIAMIISWELCIDEDTRAEFVEIETATMPGEATHTIETTHAWWLELMAHHGRILEPGEEIGE